MYESTLLYSIAFGAFFGLLVLRQPVYIFARALCPSALQLGLSPFLVVGRYLSIYLIYPTVLNRRKFIERWSCADSLLLLTYVLATGVCVVIPLPDIDQVVTRTGTLSVINLLFCFASPCLGMLADVLHISLHSCRRLHASLGTLAFILAVLHVVVGGITTRGLNLQTPKNIFGLVVSTCVQLKKVLILRLAGHFTFMRPDHTADSKKHLVRSSLALAPDIGNCFSIRSLAPYQIRPTPPRLVRDYRRRYITYKLCYLAWLRHLSQWLGSLPGSDVVCQGYDPNPAASVPPSQGKSRAVHRSLGSIREPVVFCANAPLRRYILV